MLNGQTRTFEELSESPSLEELIASLGFRNDRVAVEHNGEIAARSMWSETALQDGDRLELVHFVGGGNLR